MEAENLRWVFHEYRRGVGYFLANENNEALGFPFLRYLTKKELKLLDDLGIKCSTDPANHYYTDVFPKEYRESVMITAPVYIEVWNGKEAEYQKRGVYTEEYINLKDLQFVCETIAANIPQHKIHFSGRYVPVSE